MHRELIENLVVRDIKARYKQSTLGVAWTILNPLVMALIFTLVGKILFKQNLAIPFVVYAYFGLLFWNMFASGVTGATESLVSHLGLITKVNVPREVFPISAILAKLIDFGFGLLGCLPLFLWNQIAPSPRIVLIIPLLLIQVVFTAGLGMLFACANLFYRDVRHLIQLLLAAWLYLVPNFYTLDLVTPRYQPLYLLNPIAAIIESARRLAFPQLGDVLWEYIAIAAAVSVVTFIVGYVVFKRYEPRFAEYV